MGTARFRNTKNILLVASAFLSILFGILVQFVQPVHAQTQTADGNGDGIVDGIDYLIWALHYGQTVSVGPASGDFNWDSQVNGSDYVLWLSSYGGAVPTPSQQPLGNIALNKTVTASSHDVDAPDPSAVVDGDTTTRWSSAWSQPQWIQIDLGQSYQVQRVVLNWQRSYGSSYRIEISDNASTWSTIYSTTTGNGGIDDLSGLNAQGRYVRMYGVQRACDTCGGKLYGFSLFEFEVYATSQGGQTGTPTRTPTPRPTGTTATPTVTIGTTRTPTPTPPVTGAGCYVKVAGVLYNMRPAVGIKLIDPNTNKSHTHSTGDFKCGTLAAPTDMTNTYLNKHLKLGCAPRLAPYVVTPPAPDDPTCQ